MANDHKKGTARRKTMDASMHPDKRIVDYPVSSGSNGEHRQVMQVSLKREPWLKVKEKDEK